MEQMIQAITEQTQKIREHFMKSCEDAAGLNYQTVNACVNSTSMLTKGVESLHKAMWAATQTNLETYMAASKAMLGVKTFKDFVDVQSDYMRTQVDQLMQDGSKITETTMKVTSEAMQPINDAVVTAFEKINQADKNAA